MSAKTAPADSPIQPTGATMPKTAPITQSFASLPALGQPLHGGIFAGLTTTKAGEHCAVVLLPGRGAKLTWKKAITWATKEGGALPSRPVAALIFANVTDRPTSGWHWTSEELADDASCAWICGFGSGTQGSHRKSYEGSAVCVRMIPIIN